MPRWLQNILFVLLGAALDEAISYLFDRGGRKSGKTKEERELEAEAKKHDKQTTQASETKEEAKAEEAKAATEESKEHDKKDGNRGGNNKNTKAQEGKDKENKDKENKDTNAA